MTNRAPKKIAARALPTSAGAQFDPQPGTRIALPSGQVVVVVAAQDGEATCNYVERVRGEVVFSLRWLFRHGRIC